jgi:hypothetical protein
LAKKYKYYNNGVVWSWVAEIPNSTMFWSIFLFADTIHKTVYAVWKGKIEFLKHFVFADAIHKNVISVITDQLSHLINLSKQYKQFWEWRLQKKMLQKFYSTLQNRINCFVNDVCKKKCHKNVISVITDQLSHLIKHMTKLVQKNYGVVWSWVAEILNSTMFVFIYI